MFELLIVIIVITVALTIRSKKRRATENNAAVPRTSYGLTNTLFSKGWLKWEFIIGVPVLLFFFWDRIKVPVAEWLADSDAGMRFGWEVNSISGWLWVPVMVPIVYFLFLLFRNKNTGVGMKKSGTNAKDFWNGLVDFVVVTVFLGIIAFGLLLVGGVIIKVSGVDKAVVDVAESMMGNIKVKCVDKMTLGRSTVNKGGRDIVICPNQKVLYVYPEFGHRLQVKLSPAFAYGHLMENRSLQDFVIINPPGTFLESNATSWRIVIKPDEWKKSGLNHLTLYVSAIP